MSSYTPNIPQSGLSLGRTRDAIRDNFANYYNTISTNHVSPDQAGAGKHKFLQMPLQNSDPTTAANELAYFTKLVNGVAYTHLRQPNNGAVIQISGKTPTSVANKGSTFLPGGLLLQWGRITVNTNALSWVASYQENFSLPAFSVSAITSEKRITYISNNTQLNQMTISIDSSFTGTIYWMAIGLA